MRQIGQRMACLGSKDYRLIGPRQIDFRLSRQVAGYKTMDPPPNRVKPVPLGLLRDIHKAARHSGDIFELAVVDMAIIALFYLCRPGEYAATSQASPTSQASRSLPFRLQDVECAVHNGSFKASVVDMALITLTHFVCLVFTTQKNCVQGEKVGHGRSSEPYACPVQATIRRIQHLRLCQAPPDTPLYCTASNNQWKPSHLLTSPIPCAQWPPANSMFTALLQRRSQHGASVQEAPWHSSAHKWTPTLLSSLGAGGWTSCSIICIFKLTHGCRILPQPWHSMAHSLCSPWDSQLLHSHSPASSSRYSTTTHITHDNHTIIIIQKKKQPQPSLSSGPSLSISWRYGLLPGTCVADRG